MIEKVYSILSDDTTIMQMVGDKLHYSLLPQGDTPPAIIIQHASLTTEQNFASPSTFRSGAFRVNILGTTPLEPHDIGELVIAELNGHRDPEQGIAFIALADVDEIPAVVPEGQERPQVYGIRIDFRIGLSTAR